MEGADVDGTNIRGNSGGLEIGVRKLGDRLFVNVNVNVKVGLSLESGVHVNVHLHEEFGHD